MTNNKGRAIPNQFIITDADGQTFQSYNSLIVRRTLDGKTVLDANYWDYSRTTSKYRAQFLGESTAETRAKIASGVYQLENLN